MSLKNQNIVFLSHQRWNTHVTAVHNIVTRLAKDNRLLFMEPPDSIAWILHEPAARESLRWVFSPLERKTDNFYIFHTPPFFLPGQSKAGWISRSVSATFRLMVRSAMKKVNFESPIFWIYQFNTGQVVESLSRALIVYDCAEEWAEYETRPQLREYIRGMDERLCRQADVVLVPSHTMYQRKKPFNEKIHLVPWGADIKLYSQARRDSVVIPEDVAGLTHPIVGMFGMLDGRRLDVGLIRHLAVSNPGWNIVLVGRCMPNLDTSPLAEISNVHFLGMKDVSVLPAYCKAFDVCIIPYLLNEFTKSIMPLKLAEYLATGKPIVSTALPAAMEFADVVYIAKTNSEFEQSVRQALAENQQNAQARIDRANLYDWDLLIQKRMRIVADSLSSKGLSP